MYVVETYHHEKDYRNGDLEDRLTLVGSSLFKLKKEAVAFIEKRLAGKPARSISRYPHTGNTPSEYFYFTGEQWQHENSGATMYEYYQYKLKKM